MALKQFILIPLIMLSFIGCGDTKKEDIGDDGKILTIKQSINEAEFCQFSDPEECFTLVLQIPTNNKVESLGVSLLGLGLNSNSFSDIFLGSCNEGLRDFFTKNEQNIKETRCVVEYGNEESKPHLLKPNERGLSVRITDFDLTGWSHATKGSFKTYTLSRASLMLTFGNMQVFSKQEHDVSSKWIEVRMGSVFSERSISVPIRDYMHFTFSGNQNLQFLQSFFNDLVELDLPNDNISNFAQNASEKLNLLKAYGDTRSSALLIMIGTGIDSLRYICDFDNDSSCKTTSNKNPAKEYIAQVFYDNSPIKQQTIDVLMSSFRSLPGEIIKSAITKNGQQ